MNQKECPSCAMMIDREEDICPICEYEFPKRSKVNQLQWIALLLALLFILTVILN